jgi:ketosteroid isomerase-like protein
MSMDKVSNQQILEQTFRHYAAGNMSAVLSSFDKDIVWVRPGEPSIPFSGIFKGIEEVTKMFAIVATTLTFKAFSPGKICTDDDTVVVLGHDMAEVVATGKTYSSDWVQAFTFKDGKIIYVKVYLDTKTIADAFLP